MSDLYVSMQMRYMHKENFYLKGGNTLELIEKVHFGEECLKVYNDSCTTMGYNESSPI